MMRGHVLVVGLLSVVVGACSSARYTFPTAEQLGATGRFDEEQVRSLESGRTLAVVECADCHRMYWPAEYTAAEWPRILSDMGRRASLSEDEVNDLELYFTTVVSDRIEPVPPPPAAP